MSGGEAAERQGAGEVGASAPARPLDLRLGGLDPARIIAFSRLLLAAAALLAIYIDPTQPTRYSHFAYAILAAYAAFSLAIVIVPRLSVIERGWQLAVHGFDLLVFAALVYLTTGPTSPFFVLFTFAIISGALRWGAAGAAVTAVILLIVLLGVTGIRIAEAEDIDLNRVIVRCVYLVVAAVLIGYFGWHRQQSAERLQRLAAWPVISTPAGEDPPLASSLQHAALVLGVQRVLVVWEEQVRPGWRIARWNGSQCSYADWTGDASPIREGPPQGGREGAEPDSWAAVPTPEFLAAFAIGKHLSSAFSVEPYSGIVVVEGTGVGAADAQTLCDITARRVALDFEHHRLSLELAEVVVARERARLARDMHDGILQDLAAAGLHLKAMSRNARGEDSRTFNDIIELLMEQQTRVREFVSTMNPRDQMSTGIRLAEHLDKCADALARQWKCRIQATVEPQGAEVALGQSLQIRRIVEEATANSVRHGGATDVRIGVTVGERMKITVTDNGGIQQSLATGSGSPPEPPFSIAQRVAELGGSCILERSSSGVLLAMDLPRSN